MIPNRDGKPSSRLSVLWAVLIRDKRRKRNPWHYVEAHSSRDLAKTHRDRISNALLYEVVVRRCAVGEVV